LREFEPQSDDLKTSEDERRVLEGFLESEDGFDE
jgi:hypothetical protein